jgi:hypothetical protein
MAGSLGNTGSGDPGNKSTPNDETPYDDFDFEDEGVCYECGAASDENCREGCGCGDCADSHSEAQERT